jgi:hypothetical protein
MYPPRIAGNEENYAHLQLPADERLSQVWIEELCSIMLTTSSPAARVI